MQKTLFSTYRQKQVVRGLRQRVALCRSKHAETATSTEQRLEEIESQYIDEDKQTRERNRADLMNAITSWDFTLEKVWVQAEKTALQSLQKEAAQLNAIQKRYQTQRATAVTQHQTASEQLAKDYDVIKVQPLKQLEKTKNDLRMQLGSNMEAMQIAHATVVQRGLSIPDVKTSIDPDSLQVGTVRDGFEQLQGLKSELQSIASSITKHVASRFGMLFIILGTILGVAATVLIVYKFVAQDPITVVGSGLGAMVVLSLALFFGMRPLLGRSLKKYFPLIQDAWDKGQLIATKTVKRAEEFCKAEQVRLLEEFKSKKEKLDSQLETTLKKLQQDWNVGTEKIRSEHRSIREISAKQHTEGLEKSNDSWKPKLEDLRRDQEQARADRAAEHCRAVEQLKQDRRQSLTYLRQRLSQGISESRKVIETIRKETREIFPDWSDSVWLRRPWKRTNQLATIPVGDLQVAVDTQAMEDAGTDPTRFEQTMPLHFRMVEDGYLAIEASPELQPIAHQVVRNTLLRALTSLPAGNVQMTIIDPIDLGREFSWLMHLADTDPKMVNYRVWTQNSHVTEQLGRMVHHTEDVIQQLLRDKYRDIREYNRDAGSMAEAHRILIWSRFPAGLDDISWKALSSLLASGGRCGVSVLLLCDPSLPWPSMIDRSFLENGGLRLRVADNRVITMQDDVLGDFIIQPGMPPDEIQQHDLLSAIAEDASKAGRVEVPFETIVPAAGAVYHASTAEGLSIPIGQAGIGRSQYLKLGVGTSQHVLIAGKTGSGKSSLLHTMITSAALRYGPDQLRMVLLDFKKGVEFQVYSECGLEHADIIGIESQREFGLSALEYLDRVMQKRGEQFRQAGVQDVASWVRKNPNVPMPRVLVVIDEFQELFVEDDKLAQQASMLLDRIVRQGRSFGIHVVLASQTLGGAYSLPRTTLAQMAVRIALQCEGSDAMIILSEDNLAAERLRHAGQAIYNDASGRVEGNSPFQVAYISKSVQEERFAVLPDTDPFADERLCGLGRQVIFDGNRAATWDANVCIQSLDALPARDANSFGIVLGDSVSIEPAVAVPLSRQAGRNVLIMGTEDRNAADAINAIVATACYSIEKRFGKLPELVAIDGSRPDDKYAAQIPSFLRGIHPQAVIGDVRTATEIVEKVYRELTARNSDPESSRPPYLFVISQLARLRDLRKNDEFSFGGSDEDTAKPDAMLQEILRDGPGVGIHTVVWVDNWNSLSRWLARQSLHDLEIRILMQMSSNDSNNLIDSPIANRLDTHVMLVYDEAAGSTRKFRPYRIDTFDAVHDWVRSTGSHGQESTEAS